MGWVTFTVAAWSAGLSGHWLDAGEFTATAIQLGLPHPPGHPLFQLLSQVVLWWPAGSLPVRVAWGSALALGLAWAALTLATQTLLRTQLRLPLGLAGLVASLTALGGSLSASSLLQGVRAEVYALNAALVLSALLLLLESPEGPADPGRKARRLHRRLGAVLLLSLGLTNHHYLTLLAAPGCGLIWLVAARSSLPEAAPGAGQPRSWVGWFPRWQELGLTVLVTLVGLLTYLFLPARAASTTSIAWGDPTTPERFWWVVSARVFQKAVHATLPELLTNLSEATLLLMEPLHPLGMVAACIGLVLLARSRPSLGLGLLLVIVGTMLSQSVMGLDPFNPDLHGYFLVAQAVLALACGYCAGWALAATRSLLPVAGRLLVTILLAALLAAVPIRSWFHADEPLRQRQLVAPAVVARLVLDRLPPHGIAVTSDFSSIFLLWGFQASELRRPDVQLVHRNYLPFPGWFEREVRRHPELRPLLELLRQPSFRAAQGDPSLPGRPLRVEPYHNLDPTFAAALRPDGLLHRWAPHEPPPRDDQPAFWNELGAALTPADLEDPQTRRYLFWQHVLQGQQYRQVGAPAAALQAFRRALALAPGNPDVLGFVQELVRDHPEAFPRWLK